MIDWSCEKEWLRNKKNMLNVPLNKGNGLTNGRWSHVIAICG